MPRGPARGAAVAAAGLAVALLLALRLGGEAAPVLTFSDVTARAGLTFEFVTDLRRGRMLATMGGGVAAGDFDGDDALDLFFTGSVADGRKPLAGPCGVLYRNRGDGTFEDVTERSRVRSCGWTMGASWVDLDSNGRLDLVVTGLGRTEVWMNHGGTFEAVDRARGIVAERFAIGLAAGDVTGDGRVDLYVLNYLETDYVRENSFPQFQLRLPEDYAGQDAYLFVQREDGTFEDRAAAAGVTNREGKGLAAVFFDYDGDGVSDLYVTNDRVPNKLWRGRGDGTFEDVTDEAGAGKREQPEARAGMGLSVGDLDGDGRPEVMVTNYAGEPNSLYRNVEGVLFDDATETSGIARASHPQVQWGSDFPDLDDDGRPDVVAASGSLIPKIFNVFGSLFRREDFAFYNRGDRSYKQPPLVWRNLGDGRFAAVSGTAGDWGRTKVSARGLATGDVDGDGRLDVALAAVKGGIRLFRNDTRVPGVNALEILPVAGKDRRTPLGTKVIVTAGGRRQVKEFLLRPAYASGAWTPLHFGLGPALAAETVEVILPGGTEPALVFRDVAANKLYALRDGRLDERRALRR